MASSLFFCFLLFSLLNASVKHLSLWFSHIVFISFTKTLSFSRVFWCVCVSKCRHQSKDRVRVQVENVLLGQVHAKPRKTASDHAPSLAVLQQLLSVFLIQPDNLAVVFVSNNYVIIPQLTTCFDTSWTLNKHASSYLQGLI